MLSNIKGIFFDLYGTLLVFEDVKSAWSDWLSEFYERLTKSGLNLSMKEFSGKCDLFFSKSKPALLKDDLTVYENRINNLCLELELNVGDKDIEEIANRTADAWHEYVSPDKDTLNLLENLYSTRKLALVSNFDHPPYVFSVITKFGFIDFFDSIVISGEVGIEKPNPRIFDFALDETGLNPEEVIYVGDTKNDMIAARDAGIKSVLIIRKNIENGIDFSIKKQNKFDHELLSEVITITELSEIFELLD